jgi:hypothetical protein
MPISYIRTRRRGYPKLTRKTSNPEPWTPFELEPVRWWDASINDNILDALTNGNPVAPNANILRWNDLLNTAASATTTTYPIWLSNYQNGLGVVRFQPSNSSRRLAFSQVNLSVFSIFIAGAVRADSMLLSKSSGNFQIRAARGNPNANSLSAYTNGAPDTSSNTALLSLSNFSILEYLRPTSTSITFYQSGAFIGLGSLNANLMELDWFGPLGSFNLNGPDADYGEVLIFDKALTVEERELVEGYLAHKWGITAQLPTSHPFKISAPLIGQENNSNNPGGSNIETFDAAYPGLAFLNDATGLLWARWNIPQSENQDVLVLCNHYASDSNNIAAFLRSKVLRPPSDNTYQYRAGFVTNNNQAVIGRVLDNSFQQIVDNTAYLTALRRQNRWLWYRCRVNGGTQQLKIWEYGTPEPSSWLLTMNNAEITGVGDIGVRINTLGVIHYIAADIAGSVAPFPEESLGSNQYREDFVNFDAADWANADTDLTTSTASVGMCPLGWGHLFRSTAQSLWQCLNGNLTITKTVAERQVLGWLSQGIHQDVEALMEASYNAGLSSTDSLGGAIVRCSGLTSTTENGYSTILRPNGDREIVKYVNGNFTVLVSNTDWSSYPANTPVFHRIRAIGTTIQAKIWSGTLQDEPASWLLTATDSNVPLGYVGINAFLAATYTYNFFSVGWNGQSAPSP